MISNILKKIEKVFSLLPKQHKVIISTFTAAIVLFSLIPSEHVNASKQTVESAYEIGKRYQLSLPNNSSMHQTAKATKAPQTEQISQIKSSHQLLKNLEQSLHWSTIKVKRGDSLAKILHKQGFSSHTTYNISQANKNSAISLTKIKVNDTLRLGVDNNGKLAALLYPVSATQTLIIHKNNDNYQETIDTKTVENRIAYASGVIKSNLWNAGLEAGISNNQIIELANIFGWDIDFSQDLRANDQFNIVYEKQYIEGDYIGTGNILAAEFVNQNEVFQAIRFDDGNYYTPSGASMRKAFLRAPVNFRYISSNFKKRRFHPIQKRWKAHNGTDYRAKTGTPVVAAGDGRVIKSSYNRFNGNYVFIQHGNAIETKYLHFSKRAVKKGQYVKQGQVIGYVGQTGLAEAPHLHYEFLVNGVPRNPRTVKLPNAQPIAAKHKAAFLALAKIRLKQIDGAKTPLLAMNGDND